MRRIDAHLAIVLIVIMSASCSQLPGRIPMPDVDPEAAGEQAVADYDADQDGLLNAAELAASPPLLKALPQIDGDGDGSISADEIARRVQSWIDRKQSLHVLPCQVYWRGQELVGAEVRFIPEPFLGRAFRGAGGVTDKYGTANIVHAPEDRPDPEFPQGIRVGFYRVEVSRVINGKEQIPPRFNTESELGQEVSADAAGMGQGMLTFQLR